MSKGPLDILAMRNSNKPGFLQWLVSLSDSSLELNKCSSISKFRKLSSKFDKSKLDGVDIDVRVDKHLIELLGQFPCSRIKNLKSSYFAKTNRARKSSSSMALSLSTIDRVQAYSTMWNSPSNEEALKKILDIVDSHYQK